MSYIIPLMNPIEDKIQDKDMTQNKVPSLDKAGSASKTETEHTETLDTKKRSLPLSSSDDKKMVGQEPKDMTIKKINQHMMIKVVQVCLYYRT